MADRKLARVVKLDDVIAHSNADSLELAIVGGWQCCVKKGEFQKGDLALYMEIDALVPVDHPEFSFLEARGNLKEVNGKRYSRIKTIKLRKELSQGLVVPVPSDIRNPKDGDDVTKALGIIKYEKPEVGVNFSTVAGVEKSTFLGKILRKIATKGASNMMPWPSFIPKTDQERVQNMSRAYEEAQATGELFEVSYKLDGSSWTAFRQASGNGGVCSRNFQLRTEDVVYSKSDQYRNWIADFVLFNKKFFKNWKLRFPELRTGIKVEGNNFVNLYKQLDIPAKLRVLSAQGYNVAIQGEMIGPGIQANFEGNKELDLYIFSVYDLDKKKYMLPDLAKYIVEKSLGLKYVPLFNPSMALLPTVKEALDLADGPSAFPTGKFREGLVYKSLARDFSFKTISNSYLLKTDG